jgi:hypothetical protein
MSALDTLKPGQLVRCTLTKAPRSAGSESTVARLMRNDPSAKKALRRSQKTRAQNVNRYNRGNRMWISRVRPGKVVRVVPGQDWTMTYRVDMLPDLKSVEAYLEIRPA